MIELDFMSYRRSHALLFILGALAFVITVGPRPVAAFQFTKQELVRLDEGETVLRKRKNQGKGGVFGGSGWAVVDAPVDAIWRTILNWSSYTKIFPNTVECTELSRKNGRSLLRMKLGHPVISVTYHVEMQPNKKERTIKFTLVESFPHDLDAVNGYWKLVDMGGGRTLIGYIIGVTVPMGIVNIVPDTFKRYALEGILGVPGILKRWMEKSNKTPSDKSAPTPQ